MEARYLNVDLVVESDTDLTAFVAFLESRVFFLWKELTSDFSTIGLETNLCNTTGPEADMLELLDLIESLPSDLKSLWANSKKKVMDIGYECGSIETPINSFISARVVQRMAHLGCAINIRIYPSVELTEKS